MSVPSLVPLVMDHILNSCVIMDLVITGSIFNEQGGPSLSHAATLFYINSGTWLHLVDGQQFLRTKGCCTVICFDICMFRIQLVGDSKR